MFLHRIKTTFYLLNKTNKISSKIYPRKIFLQINNRDKRQVIFVGISALDDIIYNLICSSLPGAQSICEKIMQGKLTQDNTVLATHLGKDSLLQISECITAITGKVQIFRRKHWNVIVAAI